MLRKQITRLLLGLCLLVTSAVKAQELWGASNSNYAGTIGHELNPASIVACPFKWEVHLISADLFAHNNYLYLKKTARPLEKLTGENRFLRIESPSEEPVMIKMVMLRFLLNIRPSSIRMKTSGLDFTSQRAWFLVSVVSPII